MKKLFSIFLLLFSVQSFAQTVQPLDTKSSGVKSVGILSIDSMHNHRYFDTATCKLAFWSNVANRQNRIARQNGRLYIYNGTAFELLDNVTGVDTTSLSNRIEQRVKYTDTALMLTSYVKGAASSINDDIVSFNGTTGKVIKDALIKRNRLVNSMNVGLVEGGALSINADPTKFNISDGNGSIIAQWTDPNNPVIYNVSWSGLTGLTTTYLNTSTATHVLIDSVGAVLQQTSYPTNAQFRRYIYLGQLGHTDLTTISTATSMPQPFVGLSSQFRDYEDVIGFINNGNIITANGANLKLNKSDGFLNASGINFQVDKFNPNRKNYAASTAFTFRYRTQTGAGVSTSDISPGFYDVAGTITALSGTKYTNQRVFLTTGGNVAIQYGQAQYNTMSEATAAINTEPFTIFPNLADNSALIGILTVRSTATDLTNTTQATFTRVSKFGEAFSSAGGSAGTVTSIATNNGTGITGGTITSTGTLAIDTTLLSTRAWRQKGIDSLNTNIALKAPLASPALTGTPTAPTAAAGTNTTQLATTAHVFAERTNAATLTNKTLTSPVINVGSDANGDIYYRNGGVFTRLPIGTSAQTLHVVSGLPAWRDTAASGGSALIGYTDGAATGNTAYGNSAATGAIAGGGFNNTANGYQALQAITSGSDNYASGSGAGKAITTQNGNTLVGRNTGKAITDQNNTSIGAFTMNAATTAQSNTVAGYQAAFNLLIGDYNCLYGTLSGYSLTGGSFNYYGGDQSGFSNVNGARNIGIGSQALYNGTGDDMVGIGNMAGSNATTAIQSTAIGAYAQLPSNTGSGWMSFQNILTAQGATGTISSPVGKIGIGTGTTTIPASVKFQVTSTTEGAVLCNMTTTQRTAISSPAEGLIVYDTTLHKLYVFDGTLWQACW